jgi:hypothetical protein
MNFLRYFKLNWLAASRNIWGFSLFPKIGKLIGLEYDDQGSSAPPRQRD